MKISSFTILTIIILVFSLIVRINRLDHPLAFGWGDGARDYLVAHHIVKFGEFPLLGPFTPYDLRNSPIYYYVLAFFLLFHDSIVTLGVVNIGFQLITILLLYVIAHTLFGKKTALTSVLIFSFSPKVLEQSTYIWQPHLMQPFAYAAFYFLLLGYIKKRYVFFVASTITFLLAVAFHHAALTLAPQLLILTLMALIQHRATIRQYLGLAGTTLLSLFLLYLPVSFYAIQIATSVRIPSLPQKAILKTYGENLSFNTSRLFDVFFSENWDQAFTLGWFLITVIGGGFLFFAITKNQGIEKRYILIILITLVPIIAAASFFSPNYQHYLILIYGLVSLLIGSIMTILLSKRLLLRVVGIVFFLLFFYASSSRLQFLQNKTKENSATAQEATSSLVKELSNIKKVRGYTNFRFFQVVSYASHNTMLRFHRLDTVLWVLLEEAIQEKFVKVDNSAENHTQTNETTYLILACYNFENFGDFEGCMQTFHQDYPTHKIIKHLYTHYPFSIYLTTRIESY